MEKDSFFVCECGSDILALSHRWMNRHEMEEVGFVQNGGRYEFDAAKAIKQVEENHEWIAYCGGCGRGVTVEWLPENRVRLLLAENNQS